MNIFPRVQGFAGIIKIVFVFLTGVLAVPLIIGSYYQIAVVEILGLVGSILILQPFAVVVGLGLGINPVSVPTYHVLIWNLCHFCAVWYL